MFKGGRGGGFRSGGGRGLAPPPSGRSGGSLSARFSQLEMQNQRKSVKNTNMGGVDNRRVTMQTTQRNKRDAMQNAFRQGGDVRAANRNAQGGGRGGRQNSVKVGGRGGRGGIKAGRGGRGGKQGGRGKGGDNKGKPKSKDDLDLEMASYWHEAGKGPDPKEVKEQLVKSSLDDEMEDYWAAKNAAKAAEGASAEETAAEA